MFFIYALVSITLLREVLAQNVWNEFVESRKDPLNPTPTTLPDYSFAGYRFSKYDVPSVNDKTVFDVADYGAVPDDDGDDSAAIQAAIDACGKDDKGGVIQLAGGRYLLAGESRPDQHDIHMSANGCILKGEESSTNLHIPFIKANRKYSILVGQLEVEDKSDVNDPLHHSKLASIVSDSPRETFFLEVDDSSELSKGQDIILSCKSPGLAADHLSGLPARSEWTRQFETGMLVYETHTIVDIDDKRIQLNSPLHIDVTISACDFEITSVSLKQEIGIQDLTISGLWNENPEEFSHHKNDIHDSGFSAIMMNGVKNSWVKNVVIDNCNEGITVARSKAVTVEDVEFTGKRAHIGVQAIVSYGILMQRLRESANHEHGFGTGFSSSGTVIRDSIAFPGQTIDSHTGTPYATLHETLIGGVWKNNGGKIIAYPNHGRWLTLWNCQHFEEPTTYDLWPVSGKGTRSAFAFPIIVGMTGGEMSFVDDQYIGVLDSVGAVPETASLFDAQLHLRPDFGGANTHSIGIVAIIVVAMMVTLTAI